MFIKASRKTIGLLTIVAMVSSLLPSLHVVSAISYAQSNAIEYIDEVSSESRLGDVNSIPELPGLGHLLKGFNALAVPSAKRQIIVTNLKHLSSEAIFKDDTYDVFKNKIYVTPTPEAGDNVIATRSMTSFLQEKTKGWGFSINAEAQVKGKIYFVEASIKSSFEQKVNSINKSIIKDTFDELYYESYTWTRRAIHELDTNDIPQSAMQQQLHPGFEKALNGKLHPSVLFSTYGTHFITQYSLGGWIEASYYSVDRSKHNDISAVYEWDGAVVSINNAIKEYGERSNMHESNISVVGGRPVFFDPSDITAANKSKTEWAASVYDSLDLIKDCQILTIDEYKTPIKMVGIWELLPVGEWERYEQLVNYYIDASRQIDNKFQTDFVYRRTPPIGNLPKPNASDVKLISTEAELVLIGNHKDYPLDGDYLLTNDIELTGTWTPIGSSTPFIGSFSGNGYIISNVSIVSGSFTPALFGLNGGSIEALSVVYNNDNGHRPNSVVGQNIGLGKVISCFPDWQVSPIYPNAIYDTDARLPNNVSISERQAIVDLRGMAAGALNNRVIKVSDTVETIVFRGNPDINFTGFTGLNIVVEGNATVILDNFRFIGRDNAPALRFIGKEGSSTLISIGSINNNRIAGRGNYHTIHVDSGSLAIYGNSNLTITHANPTGAGSPGRNAIFVNGDLEIYLDGVFTATGS
ncbi:MAG: MACPF domain-containing protein, partial [Symbiobacteriaceae bacterium]|nr:MACPF domain-containing protein [Symbiobacteriaceae bacterium]